EDVVVRRVAGAAILDVQRPAPAGSDQDGVVLDNVVLRRSAPVGLIERNAAGEAVVKQVVDDGGVLHAVAVDAGAAAGAIVVDDVLLNERSGDDAVAALADVAVHVDAGRGVAVECVAADGRIIAAIGVVDAVLAVVVRRVVLDHIVVAEGEKDASRRAVVDRAVLHGDIVRVARVDAVFARAGHFEAVNGPVIDVVVVVLDFQDAVVLV